MKLERVEINTYMGKGTGFSVERPAIAPPLKSDQISKVNLEMADQLEASLKRVRVMME